MVQSTPPRGHELKAVRGKVEVVVEEHSRIKGKGRSREFLSPCRSPANVSLDCPGRAPRYRGNARGFARCNRL